MIRLKTILLVSLLTQFLIISFLFIWSWRRDVLYYYNTSIDNYIQSNYRLSLNRIEKADENLCSIIDVVKTALENKAINTTDRILLNIFFTTILDRNNFIKSFELILPNKFEYKISPTSSGWETISLSLGEKGFIKKQAVWTEDGMQMLEEESEEVPIDQSMTTTEWYKESISLCLQQNTHNREGIPKIWISPPEINKEGNGIHSRVAMAIGYEDSPFSVISWEMDWSWLQNVISDIYRDYSLYTYVISDKYVICKLGMESISSREIMQSVSIQNLPENIQRVVKNKSQIIYPYIEKKYNEAMVAQEYRFMFDYPLICVFNIPYSFPIPNTDIKILIYVLISIFVIIIFSLIVGYFIRAPLIEISQWLENPLIENQEPPIKFLILEFNILMNKIYSILYFWKSWSFNLNEDETTLSDNEIVKDDLMGMNLLASESDKNVFIFSNTGKGGIPIESISSLYRENIRLQRQIDMLNQYYLKQMEVNTKEKMRIQGLMLALKDVIRIANDSNYSDSEKLQNILEILRNTLSIIGVGIWKINKDKGVLSPVFVIPEIPAVFCSIEDSKFLIENLYWSESVCIKSAKQDYRSSHWANILNVDSFILVPIRSNKDEELTNILVIYDESERNWEWSDELFAITTSKVLCRLKII
ncbi:MAG TPA: hypothetical protein PLX23_06485 [Candidatus Hydrogenedens sp.]|nr:hypothetical protein [Candidatus Hydrogenedens sp.]